MWNMCVCVCVWGGITEVMVDEVGLAEAKMSQTEKTGGVELETGVLISGWDWQHMAACYTVGRKGSTEVTQIIRVCVQW